MIIEPTYSGPPFWQAGAHLQTILSNTLRKIDLLHYRRERIATPDDDFLDLDWYEPNKQRDVLAIVTHGLEGNSHRPYVMGMAEHLAKANINSLCWNCRSCSGEMNKAQRLYHHGDVEDINHLIHYVLESTEYQSIILVGFSMGGNINLNYVGRCYDTLPSEVRACVAISAPCRLGDAADRVDERQNFIYRNRFMKSLKPKIVAKAAQYPGVIDLSKWNEMDNWRDFDRLYSVPLNGFDDLEEFYRLASPETWVQNINIPSLLINALNDPFLSEACTPFHLSENHPYFHIQAPKNGGHVGFAQSGKPYTWSEERTVEFVLETVFNDRKP